MIGALEYAYPAHFSKLGEHDYNSGVVLPEHSPKVLRGLCQWPLCCNVSLLLPEMVRDETTIHYLTSRGVWHFCTLQKLLMICLFSQLPVPINETGIDVVRAFDSSDGLKTHSRGLIWHYINKAVLKLVAGEIGTNESWRMSFSVS